MQTSPEAWAAAQDEPGLLKSRTYFNTLISEQIAQGIPSSRIVLGGFSQGGAMALLTGLTSPEKLAGIFALSCYLPLAHKIKELLPADPWTNKDTAVFMAHGDADAVVKYEFGERSAMQLRELGMQVEFNKYPYVTQPFPIASMTVMLTTGIVACRTLPTRLKSRTWSGGWSGLFRRRVRPRPGYDWVILPGYTLFIPLLRACSPWFFSFGW
jgi:acetyl esterase/lipase